MLGACPSNRCSNPSEFDLSLNYEQALSPLEYRSDAALPPNVRDFVPKDHVSRFIVGLVRESLDLKAIMCSYVSGLGQPPFDPRMMVSLLLHGYASGLYSSRRIARACCERNDFVMIVALDPPDFRTISDFRKRHLKALGELFLQVLKLCETAGLVKLGHVALDGTKIKANASKHKAMSYERMKKREAELKAEVACMLAAAEAAHEVAETLLPKLSSMLWRRALKEGPAEALPVMLTHLRIDDGLEPASHVIWTSAITLASAPRAYARLLALNAGRLPRQISEDRLIPDHIVTIEQLDPLPVSDADNRDFATIIAAAKSVTISYSRPDVEGRLLASSPLIRDHKEIYFSRGRIAEHAASEADRMLARPSEFSTNPIAASGCSCWRNWHRNEITRHDGLLGRSHPRLQKVFEGIGHVGVEGVRNDATMMATGPNRQVRVRFFGCPLGGAVGDESNS